MELAKKHQVIGFDVNQTRVDELNNGVDLNDRNYDQIRLADSILLDIEQELTANNKPSNLK